eukprot:8992628-Alexandrium_andersonii.AAC.1
MSVHLTACDRAVQRAACWMLLVPPVHVVRPGGQRATRGRTCSPPGPPRRARVADRARTYQPGQSARQ